MNRRISTICFLAVIFPVPTWASGNDQLWEISTKMDMTGMVMPEITQTVCMKNGDAYNPGKIPHQKHCRVTDLKVSAGITSWNIYCPGREAMTGSGKVTLKLNSMTGTMDLRSKDIEMHQVISGKLIDTCQK